MTDAFTPNPSTLNNLPLDGLERGLHSVVPNVKPLKVQRWEAERKKHGVFGQGGRENRATPAKKISKRTKKNYANIRNESKIKPRVTVG